MSWFIATLRSSIGKKLMMALTGLGFIGFLAGHLAGNLTIYGGRESFNSYAEHLHSLGVFVRVAEIGLLFFAFIHITTGLLLFLDNFSSRPVRYRVNKSSGGRTLGSRSMPYTGIAILVFVIFHLINFHFVDKTGTTIFNIVSTAFQNPIYIAVYIAAIVIVALHVSHGFWSAFQTLGLNHGKYMPIFKTAGLLFSLAVGFGFGFLPVYVSMIS
ncbi:MAG: succinate dehydrogenase cytochrome b subunit [Desulfobacteraceae bacterium]|nr:succinate dehydrogenase cytochrome b subunit [Desulfobacteraceae bacterium]